MSDFFFSLLSAVGLQANQRHLGQLSNRSSFWNDPAIILKSEQDSQRKNKFVFDPIALTSTLKQQA